MYYIFLWNTSRLRAWAQFRNVCAPDFIERPMIFNNCLFGFCVLRWRESVWGSRISFSIFRQYQVFAASNKQNLEFQCRNLSNVCNCRKFELMVFRPYHVFLCSMCSKPGFWHHNVSKMCNCSKIDFRICDSIRVSFISMAKTWGFGIRMYRKCVIVSKLGVVDGCRRSRVPWYIRKFWKSGAEFLDTFANSGNPEPNSLIHSQILEIRSRIPWYIRKF